jgi:hypothetical protein
MSTQTTLPKPPPLQSCPLCGLAMVARKTNPAAAAYDLFVCLSCETELRLSRAGHGPHHGPRG